MSSLFDFITPERIVIAQVKPAVAQDRMRPRVATNLGDRQVKSPCNLQAVRFQQGDIAPFVETVESPVGVDS